MYEREYGSLKKFWAVGDVHGCHEEFDDICDQIRTKSPGAVIYQLGDLFDRGPGLIEVCEVIRKYDVQITIGNHDLSFLQEINGYKKCRSKAREKTLELFRSYSIKDQRYVLQTLWRMKNYVLIMQPTARARVVLLSHSPVKDMYYFRSDGVFADNARNFCTYSGDNEDIESYGINYSIHGHKHWEYYDIEYQIKRDPFRYNFNIDGGCCYGEEMVAVRLDLQDWIKVKSKRQYAAYGDRK